MRPPVPADEAQRLEALDRYEVLESLPEEAFDRVTQLAAEILGAPIALIELLDRERAWGKACFGLLSFEGPREHALSAWAVAEGGVLAVPDARLDPRFAGNPMVRGAPHLRALALAPLVTPDGFRVGALCALYDAPRDFAARDTRVLSHLAASVVDALELRLRTRQLERSTKYAEALLAVSKLSELDLTPIETARRAVEAVARVADVDWGGIVAMEDGRTRLVTAYTTRAVPAAFEGLVEHGGAALWDSGDALSSAFVDDYAARLGAAPQAVRAGLRSVAWGRLGRFGDSVYAFAAARFHGARPWTDEQRALFGAVARNVTGALERRAHLRALETAALTDGLTLLGNRRAFDLDLDARLAGGPRSRGAFGVGIVDLDGLKRVNDREGHARGDALLRAFAAALRAEFRPDDRLYRLGGDEYALVLDHADADASPDAIRAAVARRVEAAARRTREGGFPLMGASLGLALCPHDARTGADLVRLADARMYAAKREARELLRRTLAG